MFSYQEKENAIASHISIPNQMKWHSPFGRTFWDMKGTNKFPALRVLDNGILLLQDNAYSCGIGLIAAINDGGMPFNKMVRCDRMEIKVSTGMKVE